MNNSKYILVVSANFRKAYPILKSISKMGFKNIAAFYKWRSPVFSRYVNKRYFITNPYLNERKYIIDIISIISRDRPLMVIPVGFIDNVLLAKYKQLLPPDIILPIPSYETIIQVSRKDLVPKLCKQLGIKYPKIYVFEKGIDTPLVIKEVTDSSKPEYVFFTENLSEKVKYRKSKILIQEFIPGIGYGYFALAKNGLIIIDYTHVRIIEEKPSGGPSIVSCIEFNPEVLRLGRKIVKKLKWTGILMVEFRRDLETGEYYLLELNPKFWGSLELATSKNIDIPKYLIETFLLHRKPEVKIKYNRKCFTWVLAGLHYLKQNPKVWIKILKKGLSEGILNTDIHLNDPSELLYSSISRFLNLFLNKHPMLKLSLRRQYLKNVLFLKAMLKAKKIEHVIFDFDGTLTNLDVPWDKVKKQLIEKHLIKPWDTIMIGLYKAREKNLGIFNEISRVIRKFEDEALEKVNVDNELYILLSELYKNNIRLAVVSKQESFTVKKALSKMGILKYFSTVIGREHEILRLVQLNEVLKRLNIDPKKTIMLGDSIIDVVAALKKHILPIAIANNPYKLQQFIEFGVPCFTNIKGALKYILKHIKRSANSDKYNTYT